MNMHERTPYKTSSSLVDRIKNLTDRIGRSIDDTYEPWVENGWPLGKVLGLRELHFQHTGKVAGIQDGSRVLEVGAGQSLYRTYANNVGEKGLFVAIDINKRIQAHAMKYDDSLNQPVGNESPIRHDRVRLAVASAYELPFPDQSFDMVMANNFLGAKWYAQEVFRVLKPGGFILSSWDELLLYPTITTIQKKIFEVARFENIRVFPGMPGYVIPFLWNWYFSAQKPVLFDHSP